MARKVLDIKKINETRERVTKERVKEVHKEKTAPKPMRLKQKRRRQQLLTLCICVLCGAGLVAGLGGASHLERLTIQEVRVDGTHLVSQEEVVSTVQKELDSDSFRLFARNSIFLYPRTTIEERLAHFFPRIQHVSVQKNALLAQSVAVSIIERQAYAIWCDGVGYSRCFVLDENGYIFAPYTSEIPSTGYIFRGGISHNEEPIGQTFLLGRLEHVIEILAYLAQSGYAAEGITVINDKDFEVPLLRGPLLKISFDTDPKSLVKNMELTFHAESLKDAFMDIEYLDMRFGSKVYFKLRGQSETENQ